MAGQLDVTRAATAREGWRLPRDARSERLGGLGSRHPKLGPWQGLQTLLGTLAAHESCELVKLVEARPLP